MTWLAVRPVARIVVGAAVLTVAAHVLVRPADAAAGAAAGDGGTYAGADLGHLEAEGTAGPAAIDDAGRVAGTASLGLASRAFLHDGTQLLDLGTLPGHTDSGALDVSDTGLVAGWSSSSNQVESRAVLFDGSQALDLGDLGGGHAIALGVNDDGQVVGSSTTPSGARHGFRWSDGTMVDLNDVLPLPAGSWVEDGTRIDDRGRIIGRIHLSTGEIVGYFFDGSTVHAVRLSPGDFTSVVAFSDAGVVGSSFSSPGGSRAFVWRAGQATELPPIAGDACTDARDIDAHGRVVGTSSACGRGPTRAVLWQGGRAVDLQALLPAASGWRLRNATAINDHGQIAAVAVDAEGRSHAVVLTPRRQASLLAGADRIATAVALSGSVPRSESSTAVLANSNAPADIAVGAMLAARSQAPLLLTGPSQLDDRVAGALADHLWPGGTVALIGGQAAIGDAVAADLASRGYAVVRHAGRDRYETAVRVAEAIGAPGAVVLVSGDAIDAPAAVPVAVHERAALLFTSGATVPAATRSYLDARPGWPRLAIGRAAGAEGATESVAGDDRQHTSMLAAVRWFPAPAAVVVASSTSPADAGVGARRAASAGAPLLLTSATVSPAMLDYVTSRPRLTGALTIGALATTEVTQQLSAALAAG